MKYHSLVIDSSNLYWRAISTTSQKAIEVQNAFVYTHVIQEFFDRVVELKEQHCYKDAKVFLLFDNPTSTLKIRQMIDESYKHYRLNKNIPQEFWDTLALLQILLECYMDNFFIVRKDSCEADDLVYPLAQMKPVGDAMLLVSADMDWARSISDSVHWFNFKTIYKRDNFNVDFGFFPDGNKVKMYKTIRGDKSDNIRKGLLGIPEPVLLHIVNSYTDATDLINNCSHDPSIPSHWKSEIKTNRNLIASNYSLVDFIDIEEPINDLIIPCKESIAELRYWYKLLDLNFENRMLEKSDMKGFFKQNSYRKIRSYKI
jgi:5'-3' exonuclease